MPQIAELHAFLKAELSTRYPGEEAVDTITSIEIGPGPCCFLCDREFDDGEATLVVRYSITTGLHRYAAVCLDLAACRARCEKAKVAEQQVKPSEKH